MKIFSTPLLPISDIHKSSIPEGSHYSQMNQNEIEELNQIKDLIDEEALSSPSETSLQIIMNYGQKKLNP